MNDTLHHILPVIISILLIIVIAVAQAYSKVIAAITATMPLTIPLALWIVYAAEGNTQDDIITFTGSLFVGVAATTVFTLALWLAARAGWGLLPMLVAGYLAWASVLGLHAVIRGLV